MKEVICLLVRHGKTQGNIEKRYIGCKTDEELCMAGVDELQSFRALYQEFLSDETVYVSPMARCRQTAGILFPDGEQKVVTDLREIDFGAFENKNYEELNGNPVYQRWIDSGGSLPFPEGESREVFMKRTFDAFQKVLQGDEDKTQAIRFVVHGGSIMAIMSTLTGEDYFHFQIKCGEAYIVRCSVEEEKIHVISYDRIYAGGDSGLDHR